MLAAVICQDAKTKKMIDVKITTYPKCDQIPYDEVNKDIIKLEFNCISDEGVNIRGIKEDGEIVYLSELDIVQSVQLARAILSFFNGG